MLFLAHAVGMGGSESDAPPPASVVLAGGFNLQNTKRGTNLKRYQFIGAWQWLISSLSF